MVKRIVIVSEPHHIGIIKNKVSDGDIVIATSKNLKNMLFERGITSEVMTSPKDTQEQLMKWMKQLPSIAKNNGADMLTELSYDGFSYWWLMENWLFRGDGHFDCIFDVLNVILVSDNIIKKYRPQEIVFVDDGKLYANVIKHICPAKNIIARPVTTNIALGIALKKKMVYNFSSLFWKSSFCIRRFHARRFKDAVGKGADVIFIRGVAWETIYDYEKDEKYVREPFTDDLKERFPNSLSIGVQTGRYFSVGGMENCRGKCTILENYYDKKAKSMYRDIVKKVRLGFHRLLENKNFRESFVFIGYSIWPLVEKQFHRYFDVRLSGHSRNHTMITRVLEIENPKIVISPEEVSEFARLLFSCCIKRKIPVVAIQHGIFDTNLLCYHNKGEVSTEKISSWLCPIPTKTCVYGDYYKKLLVEKNNYPTSSVVVTGSQRFDRIFKQKFSKESFHKRHSIPFNKKIISYITSPTPFNEQMTSSLLEEIKKIPDAVVVIKIHPSENKEFYENIIKDVSSDAIVLDDADLYDVLNASDTVITYLSTAGLEAMLFRKPLAILNLTGEEDRISYAKSGAAIGIYKREDIAVKIKELLSGKRLYRKIQRNARGFIRQNAFNEDGKATDRITSLISSILTY